jgi:transcriptional antiterminator NusG
VVAEGTPAPLLPESRVAPEVVYRASAMSDEQPPVVPPSDDVPPEVPAPAAEEAAPPEVAAAPPSKMKWYVVKVQSGREESIKDAILRRVKIEGVEEFFGQIYIPVERVTEMVKNKRVTKERKLYPGYLMVEVEYNDRILYLFRETSGVGDFVGGTINKPPPPMSEREVDKMKGAVKPESDVPRPGKAPFEMGDRVRVRDGAFAGMEGEIKDVLEAKGQVRIELTLWGRPVTHELEYWQVENI